MMAFLLKQHTIMMWRWSPGAPGITLHADIESYMVLISSSSTKYRTHNICNTANSYPIQRQSPRYGPKPHTSRVSSVNDAE